MSEHEVSLVTAPILERPTCLACIAKRVQLDLQAAETVLTVIRRALNVRREEAGRCRVCERAGVVFSIDRPPA
jgi:hypothetical protein